MRVRTLAGSAIVISLGWLPAAAQTVSVSVTGPGKVTGTGIDCPSDCREDFLPPEHRWTATFTSQSHSPNGDTAPRVHLLRMERGLFRNGSHMHGKRLIQGRECLRPIHGPSSSSSAAAPRSRQPAERAGRRWWPGTRSSWGRR